MRSGWILPLAVPLVLLALPTAGAERDGTSWESVLNDSYHLGHLVITTGPHISKLDWSGIELGQNGSVAVRSMVDGIRGTEPDGVVDQAEADTAQEMLSRMAERAFRSAAEEGAFGGIVTMDDGAEISEVAVSRFDATGVVGAVDAPQNVGFSLAGAIRFDNRRADVHTIQVNAGSFRVSDEALAAAESALKDFALTVAPQSRWTVDPQSIQPDCVAERFDAARGTFEFTAGDAACFQERDGPLIAFSILGTDNEDLHFLPGFGAGLLVLASVAVGAIAARRR